MKIYLLVFSIFYLGVMLFFFLKYMFDKKISSNSDEYLFGSSNIGTFFTFLGILATLFSTFTLQGMPAFFKNHGVGSWLFLGVTDVCLAGFMLYFGLKLRHFAKQFKETPKNIVELLKCNNSNKITLLFYVVSITIFIIPYVTIQIKGAAFLFQAAIPVGESHLFWSCVIVFLMLLYSSTGGIKAIYITDALQGMLIFITTWVIAFFVIRSAGGIENIFYHVKQYDASLLNIPGPKGVLNWQFLLISFISICLMPYVQPQLATRVLVAKDDKSFIKATLVFSFFVIVVILPTIFIGFRGVGMNENFLIQILQNDVPDILYALFVVGVIAAAMSTTDSQLMAIGTEWGSFFSKHSILNNKRAKLYVKLVALLIALISLVLAQTSFKSLILFSINSFIGTSFLLPLVYSIQGKNKFYKNLLISISIVSVVIFLCVLFGIIPRSIRGIRLELIIYFIFACVFFLNILNKKSNKMYI